MNGQKQYEDYINLHYRVTPWHKVLFNGSLQEQLLCFIKLEAAAITLVKGGKRDNNYNYPKCPWLGLGLLSQINDTTVV